jgi:hypothetical protein
MRNWVPLSVKINVNGSLDQELAPEPVHRFLLHIFSGKSLKDVSFTCFLPSSSRFVDYRYQ